MAALDRNWLAVSASVAASAVAAPAAAQASGDWQYSETAETCRASRSFGSGESGTLLQLRTFGPGSTVEATVSGPQVPREPHAVRMVEAGWDHGGFEHHQAGILGTLGGAPSVALLTAHRPVAAFAYFLNDSAVAVSKLDPAAESMQIRVVGTAPHDLQVGPLKEPLRRLAECEAGLMERWGWGRDFSQRVATGPQMRDPQSWFFTAITYPDVLNLNRIASILQLRLKVDDKGRVTECVAQSSPGSSQFGEKNCAAMRRRARFEPVRDAQGQPVASYFQMSITFARYD